MASTVTQQPSQDTRDVDMSGTLPIPESTLALLCTRLQLLIRRLICMLTGHTSILIFEPRRLALRCIQCGYETPGWTIGEFTPSRTTDSMSRTISARDRAA